MGLIEIMLPCELSPQATPSLYEQQGGYEQTLRWAKVGWVSLERKGPRDACDKKKSDGQHGNTALLKSRPYGDSGILRASTGAGNTKNEAEGEREGQDGMRAKRVLHDLLDTMKTIRNLTDDVGTLMNNIANARF